MKRFLLLATVGLASCVKRGEPPLPPGAVNPEEGALSFSLPAYPGGALHRIESDRGSVVLLDVWATWCEPCREALPTYEQLLKQYAPRGLRVYAVNVDKDSSQVATFLKQTHVSLPILLDEDAAISEHRLGVVLMPTTFLLDRSGKVRFKHEGWAEEFLAKYQSELEQLLAEPSR